MNENAHGEGNGPRATPEVSLSDTITIFFSDIRGFTDTTEELGDEVAHELVREQDTIVRSHIEAYGGDVVKTQGDGFMVAFKATRGAILCAIAIQKAIAAKNREIAEKNRDRRIAIGIGINTGEPIRQEDGDYIGGTVNLAARICATAGPGQILVAESTRYVAGRIELRKADGGGVVEYVDRGLQPLKGFPEPKRLFEVTWLPTTTTIGAEPATEAAALSTDGSEIAAVRAAVLRALNVLTRVLGISHLDDPAFPSLLDCQAKASELRVAVSRAGIEGRSATQDRVLDSIKPFENLLTLMLERDTLTDEQWAQLDTAVARVFGRTLVNAAARGRLTIAMAEKPAAPIVALAPEPVREIPKEPEPAPTPKPAAAPRSSVAAALAPPPLDERATVVRWWAAGYAAWSQWKPSGLAWAHALRAELGRFPYLLSVHIRTAADHDDGQLAGGYFLLFEHVENLSPGFMRTVFDRAVADVGVDPERLGRRLYELLVDDGRLRETYASFVRDVIQVAVPTPGMWADAGIVEHDDSTTLISRPTGSIGDGQEESVRLTDPHDRGAERRFLVTVEPLTTRFFYAKSGKLQTPRDVDVRLTAGDAPSDRGWYLSVRDSLSGRSDPKLIPTAGVTIPNLGRDNFGVWVAVFNPHPGERATYELTMSIKQPRQQAAARSMFARPGGPSR
jgi:class 3 adenylate cyclase